MGSRQVQPEVATQQPRLDAAHRFSRVLVALMLAQSVTGLAWREAYRDDALIRTTWLGNDALTLLVAAPLLLVALRRARRGSARGLLLWLGMLGYGVYNYGFYLFGAALNAFFPFYVAGMIVSVTSLILLLPRIDVRAVAATFSAHTPARAVGGYLVSVAVVFFIVWFGIWAAHIFAGAPTPLDPGAFRVVAAMDLTLMMPLLAAGGVLLWRRRPWGYVVGGTAAIQGALYLLLLTLNSLLAIRAGLAEAPAEVPVWGTLLLFTGAAALLLLAGAGERTRSAYVAGGSGGRAEMPCSGVEASLLQQ